MQRPNHGADPAPAATDLRHFSAAQQFLAALPMGMASYPECQTRAAFASIILRAFPHVFSDPRVPAHIQRMYSRVWPNNEWISQVTANLAVLIVYDAVFSGNDTMFFDWAFESSKGLFTNPLNRTVASIVSPQVMLQVSANRWRRVHRHAAFHTTFIGKTRFCATVSYPAHLFAHANLLALAAGLSAAIACSGGLAPRVVITSTAAARTEFVGTWQLRRTGLPYRLRHNKFFA